MIEYPKEEEQFLELHYGGTSKELKSYVKRLKKLKEIIFVDIYRRSLVRVVAKDDIPFQKLVRLCRTQEKGVHFLMAKEQKSFYPKTQR